MSNLQSKSSAVSPSHTNFEFDGIAYAGTWSEEHRHNCEVAELAVLSPGDLSDQIDRIKAKRGEEAAQKLNIDAMQKRRELVASGAIRSERSKPKQPAYNNGAARGASSNSQRPASGAQKSSSGPFF